ncbi:MAG: glycosyltransferase family 2 protein [Nanoarchaeota archaeon]|nr:glycosyltransferase family 2 protein [Nanoarchaeota archaeon]
MKYDKESSNKKEYLTSKKLSVVVVCYKDELNIIALYTRLTRVLKEITQDYEIIYINDASPDNSKSILENLALKDKRLTVITHSRNFGAQAGFTSGMVQSLGDAVIIMDGDLQDPPELIPEFVKKWLEGYKVVYGTRKTREKSMGKLNEWMYHQFYILFNKTSYVSMPLDAGEFSLMDKVVVDYINLLPERDRLIRGLRAWVGFKHIGIPYVRPERYDRRKSVSTRGFLSAFRWARKAIFSFSYKPLEWITYLALSITFLAFLGILYYIILYFIAGAPQGFATLIVIILFFSAIQLLTLSVMGEYIGKIFEEVKLRPRYIIQEITNNHREIKNKPIK